MTQKVYCCRKKRQKQSPNFMGIKIIIMIFKVENRMHFTQFLLGSLIQLAWSAFTRIQFARSCTIARKVLPDFQLYQYWDGWMDAARPRRQVLIDFILTLFFYYLPLISTCMIIIIIISIYQPILCWHKLIFRLNEYLDNL